MNTATEDKWICPECNVEMVGIGRREMKVPMIGEDGMGECSFHPNQYRCPVCQAVAYNGAELIEQLRSRQKTVIGYSIIQASEKAIAAANRLHNRHNTARGVWGVLAFISGAGFWFALSQGKAFWLIAFAVTSLISIASIFGRKTFTTKEVWDEVPVDSQVNEESEVV